MRNIWTIAQREYKLYFISPIAYVIAFLILLTIGILFALNIVFYTQNAYMSYGATPDVTVVTGPFVFMLVLSMPALTMRLLADEQRMGTMELLLTAPLRDWELVAGKWLGSLLFVLTLIAVSLVFPLALNAIITPGIDQGLLITSYLGVLLISSAFLGIGVGISALFSNQITAFFATLVTFVIFWWLFGLAADIIPIGSEVMRYLSMQDHFHDTLNAGIISLGDLVYFLSLTAVGIFSGAVAVETRRWR